MNNIKLNSIFAGLSTKRATKLLGRGIGSGKGKTSGRGHKGQKARAGVSINGFEGGQQSIYTRLPKRGFKPLKRKGYSIVNVGCIQRLLDEKRMEKGSIIDNGVLYKLGLIRSADVEVKVLNKGKISEGCIFKINAISDCAQKAIVLAGGSVDLL